MASGPLSTRVQSLNTFPLVIVTDDEETKSQLHQSTYYRRAVASRDIKLGEVVVKEAPFAWAVREQQSREGPKSCMSFLAGLQSPKYLYLLSSRGLQRATHVLSVFRKTVSDYCA